MAGLGKQSEAPETIVRHTYGSWRQQGGWKPLKIVEAEGCYFTDSTGNRYLDFSSQLMCCNLGHGNRAVADAVSEQVRKLPYVAPAFVTDVRGTLTTELLEVMPNGLEKFFYATSGTEANEAAMKIARLYTGRYKIISRYSSYHGSTAGSIAVSGDHRRLPIEPAGKMVGTVFGPDAYCYRCPFSVTYPDCGIVCAEYVEYMIKRESNVAAVIVEPVVGSNGVIVPPNEYLPRLREITEDNDVLLIVDEVMSGWGRTGEWFAVDHWKVKPDILATAKGITGAYAPLSVTATTREIADFFEKPYFPHGHTYESHPVTLAAGVAAVREYKRLNLIQRARDLGQYLGKQLTSLRNKHKAVGDVRGLGLFWGIELVKNRETKEPFNTTEEKFQGKPMIVGNVAKECLRRGVYVATGFINHLIIAPPLIVEESEVDEGVRALDTALEVADRESN